MVEKFLTSSKQALPEKRMAQDNYSIAFFFWPADVYKQLWEELTLRLNFFQKLISSIPLWLLSLLVFPLQQRTGRPQIFPYDLPFTSLLSFLISTFHHYEKYQKYHFANTITPLVVPPSLHHTFPANSPHYLRPTPWDIKSMSLFHIRKPELRMKRFSQGTHS